MNAAIKLSSPATAEFWEIPILHEDDRLLALNKPSGLAVSPTRLDPERPALMKLLHRDIQRGAAWARQSGTTYLINTHRLDAEASGVILLAKDKPALIDLAAQFGLGKPPMTFAALVRGSIDSGQPDFTADQPLAPHPARPGFLRVETRHGKRSRTEFSVRETFSDYLLLECRPATLRLHQVRAHLRHLRLPVVGDNVYGGAPLWLSTLKQTYRLKAGQDEKPLIGRAALHAELLNIRQPGTGSIIDIKAPWPKDLLVAVKYLRRYAA